VITENIEIAGTITEPAANPAQPPERWVYQRTYPGLGNIPGDPTRSRQRRRHVVPADPRTPAQLAQRARLAAASAAWRDLPDHDRQLWIAAAKSSQLTACQLYIRHHMRSA
jgi:hypothetical protein